MNNYPDGSPIGELFNAILNRNEVVPVKDPEEARDLIERVVKGDSPATMRLLTAVGGTVRKLRSKFRQVAREEFDSAVSMALFEAVRDFDFDATEDHISAVSRLLYTASITALAPSATPVVVVPARTVRRYFAIERAARKEASDKGIWDHRSIAVRIAAEYGMSANCYFDVRNAVASCNMTQLTHQLEDTGLDANRVVESAAGRFIDKSVAEENAELVAEAFEAVDDLEAAVCHIAYGFGEECHPKADDNARSDAEVGEALGLSNSKAYRTRHKALGKMRNALLAD